MRPSLTLCVILFLELVALVLSIDNLQFDISDSTPENHNLTSENRCGYGPWSQPIPVVPDSSYALFGTALAVERGSHLANNEPGEIYVLGNTGNPLTGTLVGKRLYEGKPFGKSLRAPEGNFFFIDPLTVFDKKGTLHMVWAEPDGIDSIRAVVDSMKSTEAWRKHGVLSIRPPDKARLYYAQYRGGQWSLPKLIFRAEELSWYDFTRLRIDEQRALHLVFPAELPRKRNDVVVVYLERSGTGDWTVRYPVTAPAVYADLALGAVDARYIAYIGSAFVPFVSNEYDANSVFFRRSLDGGESWKDSLLISRSGTTLATMPQIVSTPHILHLLWGQNLQGGLTPEVIWHVRSHDAGKTWSKPIEVDVPDGFNALQAVADPCGNLQVVFEGGTGPKHEKIFYMHYDGNVWHEPTEIASGTLALDATLKIDEGGDLHMVWNRIADPSRIKPKAPPQEQPTPTTVYATKHLLSQR